MENEFSLEAQPERPTSYLFENPSDSGEEILIESVDVFNSGGASKAKFRLSVTPDMDRHAAFVDDICVGKGTQIRMEFPALIVRPGHKLTNSTNAPGVLQFKLQGSRRKI